MYTEDSLIDMIISKDLFLFFILVAVVCVALLDRLKEDQITYPAEVLAEFQERPFEIVCEYIKQNI